MLIIYVLFAIIVAISNVLAIGAAVGITVSGLIYFMEFRNIIAAVWMVTSGLHHITVMIMMIRHIQSDIHVLVSFNYILFCVYTCLVIPFFDTSELYNQDSEEKLVIFLQFVSIITFVLNYTVWGIAPIVLYFYSHYLKRPKKKASVKIHNDRRNLNAQITLFVDQENRTHLR